MKIYIIGTGMEGDKTLTSEARKAIEKADVLIGAERILKAFEGYGKEYFISWKSEEISDFLKEKQTETAAVLMSGDCGFYSGAQKLINALKDYETEIICGISSPVYFGSKIKKTWQNMRFISLHGNNENIIRNICRNEYCFFLLGGDVTADEICKRLCEYGRDNINVYIGENLGYENERIQSGKASDFISMEFEKLSVMVTENFDYEQAVKLGICDDDFVRGNVPMTKSEIRSTVISKLDIGRNDICWDIGCGTGSVSVEMALQCYDGAVYAVDKNDEAVKLTAENAFRFGCDNIRIISGEATQVISEFPAPDRVFIGGSCGKIKEIMNAVYDKNICAEIVITAVSLETLNEAVEAFSNFKVYNPEIVQIAVTRTRKLGNHTMLSAENPIFIIKGVRN